MTEIRPPAHVEPYVNILGEDRAFDFLMAYGGAELHLTRNPALNGHIAQVVGRDGAAALAAAGPRLQKRVPTAKPWLAKVMRARGLTVAAIAPKLHVTDTTVRSYLKQAPKRPPPDIQPDLFD